MIKWHFIKLIFFFINSLYCFISDADWPINCFENSRYSPLNLAINFDYEYNVTKFWKVNSIDYKNITMPKIEAIKSKYAKDNKQNSTLGEFITLEVDLNGFGSVSMLLLENSLNNKVTYNLEKLYIKIPSEHTIDKVNGDVEIQLLHKIEDNFNYKSSSGQYTSPSNKLIISIILIIDDDDNSLFDVFYNFIKIRNFNDNFSKLSFSDLNNDSNKITPNSNADVELDDKLVYENTDNTFFKILNLNQFIDKNMIFFHYKGVETNPLNNCEIADYLILNRFYTIKSYQYDYFINLLKSYNVNLNSNNRKFKDLSELKSIRKIEMVYDENFDVITEFTFTKSCFNFISTSILFIYLIIL
jgi:carbonic anhydrase